MVYGIVVTCLLAAATFFLDRGLRGLGRPTRWAWAFGMLAAVSAPLASVLRAGDPRPSTGEASIPSDLLYDIVSGGTVGGQGQSAFYLSLDPPLLLLWLLASASILSVAFWTAQRLSRAATGWPRQRLGSDEVLVSDGLGPAVVGLIRPRIVLPPWALDLAGDKLEMILLHEREHQDARDPALLALGLFLVAVTPWNPMLWWMVRRLHLAVEGDCDARVLARGVPVRRYGDLLLEVASSGRTPSALKPALAEGGDTYLERRLLMIRSTVRKNRFAPTLVAIIASAGFVALACETPTPPVPVDAETTLETPPLPTAISEAEEGYFLVRKTGDGVEYLRPVSPKELELIQENPEDDSPAFIVREEKDDPESVGVIRIRKQDPSDQDAAGPKPLIIVDGVIVSDPNIFENLNKDEIDRVEVIKGAAAAALYGERAAGGVIQIFTKH
jgi:TonB-dependent SusC/RagA subfamily outer membrane receptor